MNRVLLLIKTSIFKLFSNYSDTRKPKNIHNRSPHFRTS